MTFQDWLDYVHHMIVEIYGYSVEKCVINWYEYEDDWSDFDEILERLDKNMPYFRYKKLRAQCVTKHHGDIPDETRYYCDLKELYDALSIEERALFKLPENF